MSKADRDSEPPAEQRVANSARRPVRKKKTARANMPVVAQEEQRAVAASADSLSPEALRLASLPTLTRADLGTGRGLTYEWEFFVDQLFAQLADAGIGPQTFVFSQAVAASVWNVPHGLTAYPSVLLVDGSGQEMHAEVHYPDDQSVVIHHGSPYSGTAYLRI